VWGESVKKQTGWNISFLVGGPEPRQNGKIVTYMYDNFTVDPNYGANLYILYSHRLHCGKSPHDQNFEEFLGEDGYDKNVITPFDEFLHDAFRK